MDIKDEYTKLLEDYNLARQLLDDAKTIIDKLKEELDESRSED